LIICQDKIAGRARLGTLKHQCFSALVASWTGEERPLPALLSDFDAIAPVVDGLCRSPEFLITFVAIGLLLVDFLSEDPHPSVRNAAGDLRNFVERQNGFKPSQSRTVAMTPPPKLDKQHETQTSSFQPGQLRLLAEYHAPEERIGMCESGGDALYRVCVRQLVSGGALVQNSVEDIGVKISGLPHPRGTSLPLTRLTTRKKTRLGGTPTIAAYHERSLSLAIGTAAGLVVYESEETGEQFSHHFGDRITALNIADWDDEALVVTGTENGSVFVWSPRQKTPRVCFRADSHCTRQTAISASRDSRTGWWCR
jgi:hypothetical protein